MICFSGVMAVVGIIKMSEYFRKIIKKQHYPLLYSDLKFKTFFTNCIQQTLLSRGYKQTEDDDWNIYWCEKQFIPQTLDKIRLHPQKRINHFRNFYQITRKDLLSKNVKRFKKDLQRQGKAQQAQGYDYLPLTYNLPSQYPIFLEQFKRNKEQKAIWIMKPIGRSQGKGIFLFKAIGDISEWADTSNQPEPYIVQRYIHNPLLIGHKKFDMRIYVLVTSHNPLTIYLYRSGFGRFTHYRYDIADIYNPGIVIVNQNYISPTLLSKKQLTTMISNEGLRLYLLSKYGEEAVEKGFYQIQELVIKTLIATSRVVSNDKRCFQLYGFDVMLDANLKPWLIQINGSPSMTANTPADRKLKNGLLDDTLSIINLQKILTGEQQQIGGFDPIYKNNKRVKDGLKNFSFLGCLNDRMDQLPKLAKKVALRLAEKAREERTKQSSVQQQQERTRNNNIRNRSTNGPVGSGKAIMNRSGNAVKRDNPALVKLPKVPVNGTNVSNSSMKAIFEKRGQPSRQDMKR